MATMIHCLSFLVIGLLASVTALQQERKACKSGDRQPAQRVNTTTRLAALRTAMQERGIDVYYVPGTDPHLNEYIGPDFARRSWISGFDGSTGNALVFLKNAVLYTDSRYTLQADLQMDCNWKLTSVSVWNYLKYMASNEKLEGLKLGIDSSLISAKTLIGVREILSSIKVNLTIIDENLVDAVWEDKPPMASKRIFVHPLQYSGESWWQKVSKVRQRMMENQVNTLLVTKLDEVAWLFNLRGDDVPFTPVFYSYALVMSKNVKLYVQNPKQLSSDVTRHLRSLIEECPENEICAKVRDYDEDFSTDMDAVKNDSDITLWLPEVSTNALLTEKLKEKIKVIIDSPIYDMKVVKNEIEAKSFENCTARDSAAYVEFAHYLFNAMKQNKSVTELSAAKVLEKYRYRYGDYHGPSFETISSSGPNAAMNHYAPDRFTDRALSRSEIYLLDAGSQFLGCTTDVTRTFHFGKPSPKMIEAYTRVLAGFIDVAMSVWPGWLSNGYLTINARHSLWQNGLDYGHGTGHGVGTFLGVHEFPNGLMRWGALGKYKLRERNYQSCEPGYYENGQFGVRLETVLGVKVAKTKYHWNNNKYFTFYPVAFIPFERTLIDINLLTKYQVKWLNDYHRQCREIIGNILRQVGRPEAIPWLEERTEPYATNSAGRSNFVSACLILSFLPIFLFF